MSPVSGILFAYGAMTSGAIPLPGAESFPPEAQAPESKDF